MTLKLQVEAVLFLTDKPVPAAAVAKLVNADVQLVRQALLELIHDYEERGSALEIADDDEGYMMQVKDEYANVANDLAPIDLPLAVVRTLSAIAIKQPVMQSDIVRIRGAGAYEHIKELVEKELISKKEDGRSPLLSTTKKFQQYFRLSQDAKALRGQLQEKIDAIEPVDGVLPEEQQLQVFDQLASVDGILTIDASQPISGEGVAAESNLADSDLSEEQTSGDKQMSSIEKILADADNEADEFADEPGEESANQPGQPEIAASLEVDKTVTQTEMDDEAVSVDTDGYVAEASTDNIAAHNINMSASEAQADFSPPGIENSITRTQPVN